MGAGPPRGRSRLALGYEKKWSLPPGHFSRIYRVIGRVVAARGLPPLGRRLLGRRKTAEERGFEGEIGPLLHREGAVWMSS